MAQRPERPERPESEAETDRERRETTDLGYRDTEEERAYEQAERPDNPSEGDVDPDDEAGVGGG